LTVIDNDGISGFVAGGFTFSKSLVSGEFYKNTQDPHYTKCYSNEATSVAEKYFCDHPLTTPTEEVTGHRELGRAWIMKGIDSTNVNDPRPMDDENVVWNKFFEEYNSVTALHFAKSSAMSD
jgi:hypothetical protein